MALGRRLRPGRRYLVDAFHRHAGLPRAAGHSLRARHHRPFATDRRGGVLRGDARARPRSPERGAVCPGRNRCRHRHCGDALHRDGRDSLAGHAVLCAAGVCRLGADCHWRFHRRAGTGLSFSHQPEPPSALAAPAMQPGDGCGNRLHALHRHARADPGSPRRSRGARRAIRQPHRPGRTRLGDRQ